MDPGSLTVGVFFSLMSATPRWFTTVARCHDVEGLHLVGSAQSHTHSRSITQPGNIADRIAGSSQVNLAPRLTNDARIGSFEYLKTVGRK